MIERATLDSSMTTAYNQLTNLERSSLVRCERRRIVHLDHSDLETEQPVPKPPEVSVYQRVLVGNDVGLRMRDELQVRRLAV